MNPRTNQTVAVDEALAFVDTHRDHKPETAMGREVKRVCATLAAEVLRLREDVDGLEGVRDEYAAMARSATADWAKLRDAIVEALRLYGSGYPHGDVLRAALRGHANRGEPDDRK